MDKKEMLRQRFEAAKKAREKAEKERKSSGFGGPTEVPDFEYLELKQDSCQVFRMVGESIEMRKQPTDPILVERSIIKADDNSFFTCIWHPDKDWPLRVLARKLGKYKWEPKTKTRIYENEGCEYLARYNTNGKEKASSFETGMAPKKFVLANVIDRMDDWCKENKHTKVIAWDSSTKDDKTYYQPGMSYGLYKFIFDNKCTNIGSHFEEVDFLVRRFTEKTRPSDDTYYIVAYNEEKRVIENWSNKDKIDYLSYFSNESYLSDEEEAYERYSLENIPFISMPTPMGVVMNKLEKFIKGIDSKYGWNLWELCVEWKEKEIEARNANKEKEETTKSASKKEEQEEQEELPSEVEKPVTKMKKVAKEEKSEKTDTIPSEAYEMFEGLGKLSKEELSKVKSVDLDEMEITFSIPADVQCPTCEKDFPESFDTCPFCGETF